MRHYKRILDIRNEFWGIRNKLWGIRIKFWGEFWRIRSRVMVGVGLARPTASNGSAGGWVLGFFLGIFSLWFVVLVLILIFCNFLKMMMWLMLIRCSKTPLLQEDLTIGALNSKINNYTNIKVYLTYVLNKIFFFYYHTYVLSFRIIKVHHT